MMLSVAAAVNQAKFRIFQNQARDRYRQLAVHIEYGFDVPEWMIQYFNQISNATTRLKS